VCLVCVWQHESCSTSSHVTTSVVLCENYIGCQSVNESCISCVFSSTRHHSDNQTRPTSRTYSSQSPPLHPGLHCGTLVTETMSSHGRNGKRQIEHFPHSCIESVEPAADCTEKNTIENCLSLKTENVSFQLYFLLQITHDNDYVMRPWSYSGGLRNRNKNLLIGNTSCISCAHNTLKACIGLNMTP